MRGVCAACGHEALDLFWHEEDRATYCVNVFRCEYRVRLRGEVGLQPYYGEWLSVDGMSEAEVRVLPPDDPWPALVSIEARFDSSITAEDAEKLAAHIGAAAGNADWLTRHHRATRKEAS